MKSELGGTLVPPPRCSYVSESQRANACEYDDHPGRGAADDERSARRDCVGLLPHKVGGALAILVMYKTCSVHCYSVVRVSSLSSTAYDARSSVILGRRKVRHRHASKFARDWLMYPWQHLAFGYCLTLFSHCHGLPQYQSHSIGPQAVQSSPSASPRERRCDLCQWKL